ncbi:hypothetical protein VIMS_03326 [Mycobacterium marinum]|nr:hypothetical protein VIMS_03326 [Mycobacterium marinum]
MFATGSGGGSVPATPADGGGLTGGAATAGGAYQRAHAAATGLDASSGETVDEGGGVGARGRTASGVIRDQARVVGATTAALGRSPAGAQLIMATMDQHLAAMQRQLDQATAQNRLLALRLRELAAGYRGMGATRVGGMPLSGLSSWAAVVGVVSADSAALRHFRLHCWDLGWAARAQHGRVSVSPVVGKHWVRPVSRAGRFLCRRSLLKAGGSGLAAAAPYAVIWKKR